MKRVLLKLSGEALAGEKKTGFDEATCIGVAKQVKQLVDEGVQVAIVTGARILPRIPVKITATTVIGTTPPAGSETLTAIGVVTDLGISETVMLCSSPNNLHIA